MTHTYQPLFSIALQHEFFTARACGDLAIVPAGDTLQAFRKGGILHRTTGNQFTALLNTANQSYYRHDHAQEVFRFYLLLKGPFFINYTNLDQDFARPRKFLFSNLAGNRQQGSLPLTAPVPAYAADLSYVPGNLARDAKTGSLYEALKKNTGRKKGELGDAQLWAPKEPAACASAADLIPFTGSTYLFTLAAPVSRAEITLAGFNFSKAKPAYDRTVLPTSVHDFTTPQTAVPVSFRTLPPGKYGVTVNKETRMVYYDPAATAGNIAGVIEVYNHLPGTDPYALLTDDEQLRGVHYEVLFPARRVLWKYIRKDSRADSITDVGAGPYQFSLKGNEFVSSLPIPLSENPLKTLKLQFNTADYPLFPLPNPGVERLRRCEQDEWDYFCSEVYLNY